MLKTYNLVKTFSDGKSANIILDQIQIHIEKGKWYSIIGPSGVGKTTFLNCISGLLKPDQGKVIINDTDIYTLTERELSHFRRKNIGYVFQDFKLLPHYSVLDNVILPLIYDVDRKTLELKAKQLLHEVGIEEKLFYRLPEKLSGGEKQRVAIARSLIANPNILLCDEPTGNLDVETRDQITQLLNQVKEMGKTIIVVTHDQDVATYGDACFELRKGTLRLVELVK